MEIAAVDAVDFDFTAAQGYGGDLQPATLAADKKKGELRGRFRQAGVEAKFRVEVLALCGLVGLG